MIPLGLIIAMKEREELEELVKKLNCGEAGREFIDLVGRYGSSHGRALVQIVLTLPLIALCAFSIVRLFPSLWQGSLTDDMLIGGQWANASILVLASLLRTPYWIDTNKRNQAIRAFLQNLENVRVAQAIAAESKDAAYLLKKFL